MRLLRLFGVSFVVVLLMMVELVVDSVLIAMVAEEGGVMLFGVTVVLVAVAVI